MSRRWTHNHLLFTKLRLLKNLKKTLIINEKVKNRIYYIIFKIDYEKAALQSFHNEAAMVSYRVLISYQNIDAKKNKLNLHIYGIHLLDPYKTVVSHLYCFQTEL